MIKFLKRLILFSLPLFAVSIAIVYLDIFKVFKSYDDYYDRNFVTLNREHVCTQTYLKYRNQEKFNSFIFGNSRSQAFRCKSWKKSLASSARAFHFDGNASGLYHVAGRLNLIDQMGDDIDHALIILDRMSLTRLTNQNEHIYTSPPEISGESFLNYYEKFFMVSINPRFLMAFIDFSLFKKRRSYMVNLLMNETKYPTRRDKLNCDVWYGVDIEIAEDSLGFYQKQKNKGVFYPRPRTNYEKIPITDLEVKLLQKVSSILAKHQTDYKIILAPIYDQIPLEQEQVELLSKFFDPNRIYNFSGVNEITSEVGNYYEASHFRPHIADQIMATIYE